MHPRWMELSRSAAAHAVRWMDRLKGMVEAEKVSHGEDAGIALNPHTLTVIQEFIS